MQGIHIADLIFIRIKAPLLMDFLEGLQVKDEQRARALLMTISDVVEDQPLNAWSHQVDARQCPAIIDSLNRGKLVTLDRPCRDLRGATK